MPGRPQKLHALLGSTIGCGGDGKLPWNHSGFGSNDPGQQRDTTTYKQDHFDTQHPIRLNDCFVEFKVGKWSVAEAML